MMSVDIAQMMVGDLLRSLSTGSVPSEPDTNATHAVKVLQGVTAEGKDSLDYMAFDPYQLMVIQTDKKHRSQHFLYQFATETLTRDGQPIYNAPKATAARLVRDFCTTYPSLKYGEFQGKGA